ncbi:50S ribosomal protein L9 [Babesia divergens]|uniref:50S ribosomal protein L9 n=1 Tax=Babesia divergens TaxID=32595 RepID=A0AAD9LK54_BABDI|nr:50S ribosomal protein L9 [Babesia divergens]
MAIAYAFNALFKRYKIAAARPTIVRRVLYPRVVDKNVDVVLLRDCPPLGRKGDIVDVARGFANHRLIPHGIAVYATWENIDLYADPRNRDDHHKGSGKIVQYINDMNSPSATNDANTKSMFAQDQADIVASLRTKSFSRDNSVACTPVSLYTVLDLLSKDHQVDLLPSQIVKVVNKDTNAEYNNIKRFTHIGEYYLTAKMPLLDAPDNVFRFTFKLEAHEHRYVIKAVAIIARRDSATMEETFQLPKNRPS